MQLGVEGARSESFGKRRMAGTSPRWGRLRKLQRAVALSGRSGRYLQFYTDCQRLVGSDRALFRDKGHVAVPVYRAAGDLGRGAVAGGGVAGERHRADGIFSDRKVRLEPGVCGPGEEEGIC